VFVEVGVDMVFEDTDRPELGGCLVDVEEAFFFGFAFGNQ
jgi:hypothetical protein